MQTKFNLIEIQDTYKACIFDLDGTILDSMRMWQDIDRQYLKKHGHEFKNEYSEDIKKLTFQESAQYFIDKFDIPKTIEEIMQDWDKMAYDAYAYEIKLKPGAIELLTALQESNVILCIATSCTRIHAEMALKRLGIDHYFSFMLTCKEVGRNKEFPDVYLECAKRMEVGISETLVFEDLKMALRVSKSAGFATCGVFDILSGHEAKEIKKICDYYIHEFNDIII